MAPSCRAVERGRFAFAPIPSQVQSFSEASPFTGASSSRCGAFPTALVRPLSCRDEDGPPGCTAAGKLRLHPRLRSGVERRGPPLRQPLDGPTRQRRLRGHGAQQQGRRAIRGRQVRRSARPPSPPKPPNPPEQEMKDGGGEQKQHQTKEKLKDSFLLAHRIDGLRRRSWTWSSTTSLSRGPRPARTKLGSRRSSARWPNSRPTTPEASGPTSPRPETCWSRAPRA
eukprot:scaffold3870_cov246-Pinguiococcus_pyrenoidosus.AAC.21